MSNYYESVSYLSKEFNELGFEKTLIWCMIYGDFLLYSEHSCNFDGHFSIFADKLYKTYKKISKESISKYIVELSQEKNFDFSQDRVKFYFWFPYTKQKTLREIRQEKINQNIGDIHPDTEKFINSINISAFNLLSIFTHPFKEDIIDSIYFLFDNKQLVYIGQATSTIGRLKSHLLDKSFDSYYVLPYPFRKRVKNVDNRKTKTTIEYALIQKYLPKYNKKLNPNWNKNHVK